MRYPFNYEITIFMSIFGGIEILIFNDFLSIWLNWDSPFNELWIELTMDLVAVLVC